MSPRRRRPRRIARRVVALVGRSAWVDSRQGWRLASTPEARRWGTVDPAKSSEWSAVGRGSRVVECEVVFQIARGLNQFERTRAGRRCRVDESDISGFLQWSCESSPEDDRTGSRRSNLNEIRGNMGTPLAGGRLLREIPPRFTSLPSSVGYSPRVPRAVPRGRNRFQPVAVAGESEPGGRERARVGLRTES